MIITQQKKKKLMTTILQCKILIYQDLEQDLKLMHLKLKKKENLMIKEKDNQEKIDKIKNNKMKLLNK